MTEVTVVVGAQFGSEGKGAISAHLTREWGSRDLAVRVAGPNAGHTAYDSDGQEWKLRCVPVAAVVSPSCILHIAAGSEIDIEVMHAEINALEDAGHQIRHRLFIHPAATILSQRHKDMESAVGLVGRIGSTGKGIGAARADRIMRSSATAAEITGLGWQFDDHGPLAIHEYDRILIEGTQGYGLGLHTKFYPTVTSSDCRAIDFLAMAGVSPWDLRCHINIQLVARVFPIRVAGESGPLKGETTWEDLGLPEERTTVTNKIRRVGAWDQDLVAEAIEANGGGNFNPKVQLALTMVDQMFPDNAGLAELNSSADAHISRLENRLSCYINLAGTGPQTVAEL